MTNRRTLNGLIVILLAFVMIFSTIIASSGDNVAFAKNKYSKYKGHWSCYSGKYEAVIIIKNISKNKIKGQISANNFLLMGKQKFYERIYDFSKRVKIKNNKTSFRVKLKNGGTIKVWLKFGKMKRHKDFYNSEKNGYNSFYGMKARIKYNKKVWKHFNRSNVFLKRVNLPSGGC